MESCNYAGLAQVTHLWWVMPIGKVRALFFSLFRDWSGDNLTINARQSGLKLPGNITQLFLSSFYLFKEESVTGGRWKNWNDTCQQRNSGELWGWGKLSLLTDFPATAVLRSWWRLTYKTLGKLADSSPTPPPEQKRRPGAQRECWASESWVLSAWED